MTTSVNTTWFVFKQECAFAETYPMVVAAMILLATTMLIPYALVQLFAPRNVRLEDEEDHAAQVLSISFCARQPGTISFVFVGIFTTAFLYNVCLANENLRALADVYLALLVVIFAINPPSPAPQKWMARTHASLASLLFIYSYVLAVLAINYEIGWGNVFGILLFVLLNCSFLGLGFGKVFKNEWTHAESHLERVYMITFTLIIAVIPRGVIA